MRDACQAHSDLQAQLRPDRPEYKELLAQNRTLVKLRCEWIRKTKLLRLSQMMSLAWSFSNPLHGSLWASWRENHAVTASSVVVQSEILSRSPWLWSQTEPLLMRLCFDRVSCPRIRIIKKPSMLRSIDLNQSPSDCLQLNKVSFRNRY